jgi:acyl-CoA synthetase (NDP forming)
VLKDVAFRVAPLTPDDARQMTEEIRAAELLKGVRGEEPADLEAVTDCILRVAQLGLQFPELSECDLNPLVVFESGRGAVTVDARFALGEG